MNKGNNKMAGKKTAKTEIVTGTIVLDQANPTFDTVVTFTTTTSRPNDCSEPNYQFCVRIEISGFQEGVRVYHAEKEYNSVFLLGFGPESTWTSGAADCTASLYYIDKTENYEIKHVLATTSFTAGA